MQKDIGVNLGNLYLPRAVDEKPTFSQAQASSTASTDISRTIHVALIKIREPQSLDFETLEGVCRTISQLEMLGYRCGIVVDIEDGQKREGKEEAKQVNDQVDRIVESVNRHGGQGAKRIDGVYGISTQGGLGSTRVRVKYPDLLLPPLRRGVIPVIAPIAFASHDQRLTPVTANEAVLALTRAFAGTQNWAVAGSDPGASAQASNSPRMHTSLDRIILLDPLGGIPSPDKGHGSHVFINLEQEFDTVKQDLQQVAHVRNLDLLKQALALLPPTSSAFLITPEAVAHSETQPPASSKGPRVRTRRQRNPLIHNVLTDKPVYSSSLPLHRSPKRVAQTSTSVSNASPATFFKRGMPVSIVPDPLEKKWSPPSANHLPLNLFDSRIDVARLLHLINDSFRRELDVAHYLDRIKNRIAGVIIAGEYEGGAIFTWETPPGYPSNDSQHMVPYLDKFAVLQKSQGSGGVADIVFKAMVRDCFPNGVCWRSRSDNVVNKWYFERAKGTWKMPGTNWTMFWTTEGVERDGSLFSDYSEVCRAVVPSWLDTTKAPD